MKIATWNVNGIRARHEQFYAWVEQDRPDVICLQEIKAPAEKVPKAICDLPEYFCYWHGSGGYSGVAMLVRRDAFATQPRFHHPQFDRETRVVAAEIGDLTVTSVYVPNGGKDYDAKVEFFKELIGYAAAMRDLGSNFVLCGDINIARADIDVHPKERKPNVVGQLAEERARFEELLKTGLVDVQRTLHPDDENLFTWWAPWRNLRQRNIGWRIDYILASGPLAGKATSCIVRSEIGTSDHAPVVAVFDRT